MRKSSGGSEKLSSQLNVLRRLCACSAPHVAVQNCRNGLLSLNPGTNRQFLTLQSDVKRLKNTEVSNTNPFTFHYTYGDGKFENRAMYD